MIITKTIIAVVCGTSWITGITILLKLFFDQDDTIEVRFVWVLLLAIICGVASGYSMKEINELEPTILEVSTNE